jgi:hypothetical protein
MALMQMKTLLSGANSSGTDALRFREARPMSERESKHVGSPTFGLENLSQ